METITEFKDKCIIVRIPIGIDQKPVFEATRRCWRASLARAKKADYVLGIVDGVVRRVIEVESCDYTKKSICDAEKIERCKKIFHTNIEACERKRRIAFEGKELLDDTKYLGKAIPDQYMPGQNPVSYTYKLRGM